MGLTMKNLEYLPGEACPPPSAALAGIPGRVLLEELGRRVARRLGWAPTHDAGDGAGPQPGAGIAALASVTDDIAGPPELPVHGTPPSPPDEPPPPSDALPISLIGSLTTAIPQVGCGTLDALACVDEARIRLGQGLVAEAFGYLNRARAIVHQFPHAISDLRRIAQLYAMAAMQAAADENPARAMAMAVAALEADPAAQAPRDLLATMENQRPDSDITRRCFVFYDPERAERVHREAVLRCLEFTAIAGVIGDVYEFGVLAGWSARIFAETMRDCMIMGNLCLFDSFAGLPEYASAVDRESYEIAGRNIWSDKMKFTDEFVASLGGDLAGHIKERLSTVIRAERISTHRGFYSESLKTPIQGKAALVHIDCDLYQSTVEVLDALLRDDALQDGCVLMFDDWNCNKANPRFGERRAFREFLEKQDRYTASPFFTYGFNGAVFILHEERSA